MPVSPLHAAVRGRERGKGTPLSSAVHEEVPVLLSLHTMVAQQSPLWWWWVNEAMPGYLCPQPAS